MSNIIRVQKSKNFVVVSRDVLKDERLSWKAKGILVYMLSMPDDWTFYIDELVQHATDGKDSFRSGFNELKKNGYVERKPVRDEQTKRIIAWETIVHETPYATEPEVTNQQQEKPQMEKLEVDCPHEANPPLLKNNTNQILIKQNIDYTKTVRFDEASFEVQMAKRLLERIQTTVPTFRTPNLQRWAQHIYAMREEDGLTNIQIEQLITWCTRHRFWHAHITSTEKLREKAMTMLLQMKSESTEPVPAWLMNRHVQATEPLRDDLEAYRQRVLQKISRLTQHD